MGQARVISSLNIPLLLWEIEVPGSHMPICLLAELRSPGPEFPLQFHKDIPGPKVHQGNRLGIYEGLWGDGSQTKNQELDLEGGEGTGEQ